MRKKLALSIIIVLLLAFVGSIPAWAAEIKFTLEQKEYYFQVGEQAIIPLKINSTYGKDIDGTLSYTVESTLNQGGIHFTSSNVKSTTLTCPQGERTVYLDFGTYDSPASFSVNMKYSYRDWEDREVNLDNVKIHIVADKSQKQNSKNPVEGKSQKSTGGGSGGGRGGGMSPFGNDPFQEMDQMEKQFNRRFQRQQEEMDKMLQNRMRNMPSQPGGGSTQEKMQQNQLPQDSSALKSQMQKQLKEQQEMKSEFQKNIAKNQQFQDKHKEMEDKGYKLDKESYNPSSKDSGSFDLNYRNDKGESAKVQGQMDKGEMKNLNSTTPEDKKKAMETLEKNPEFQKLSKQLEKEGFKKQDSQVQKSQDKTSAQVQYQNDKGEKANIKAELEKDQVKKVELERKQEPEKKEAQKPPRSLVWLFILSILTAAVPAYLIYRKYVRKPGAGEVKASPADEKPMDYVEQSRKLLEEARRLFGEKQYKDAYGEAGRALRLYLTHKNGIAREMTNDEMIKYLKRNGHSNGGLKECFDLCSLVEFAKYQANNDDFDKIMDIAEKTITKN